MMIPPADAEYGIISDIDDTIIRTGATNPLGAMGKTVLFSNAVTRLPLQVSLHLPEVAATGTQRQTHNFFYVSSSPWNLYDLLIDYMDHHDIPQGPCC
ncbi:MAG: DUF2183 domain-containing protein [Chitinophagaceae bacterium]|nr:DUF2183 domain-containing protein [Chitinophagaceae bacterium]